MNYFNCKVYMFGDDRYVFIETEHTLEELKADYGLLDRIVTEEVIEMINVQATITQV